MGNQRARSRGLRHGTRNMFTRGFRQNGPNNATTYLRTFRVRLITEERANANYFCSCVERNLACENGNRAYLESKDCERNW